jgi:hypothetical protein
MRCLASAYCLTCIPLLAAQAIPCKNLFVSLGKFKESRKVNFLTTIGLLLVAFGTVLVYPDLLHIMCFCGAVFSSVIGWTVPYLIAVRLNGKSFIYNFG